MFYPKFALNSVASGLLRGVNWLQFIDVSERRIGSFVQVQEEYLIKVVWSRLGTSLVF
jgi:hypothetical protein